METTLGRRIGAGIIWSFLRQAFTQCVQLISIAVLARLLTPADYGILGMVLVFTGFAGIFLDMGLTPAVIRKQDITHTEMSTVFWTNLVMGACLFGLAWLLAGNVSAFYREPKLLWVTRITALSFLLVPLESLQQALLTKELKFRMQTVIAATALTVSTGVAIIMAIEGYGYWSLVAQSLSAHLVMIICLWTVSSWRPSFTYSLLALKGFFHFSGFLTATQVIGFFSRNLDKLILGRITDVVQLGLYTRAYTLMLMPIQKVSSVVDPVLFPAYSKIQTDKTRIAQIYLKVTRLIAIITFPMSFGLWALAEPTVLLVLGSKWLDTVPILQILCPVGALQSILFLNGSIYMSQGRTRRAFIVSTISTACLVLVFYLGSKLGGVHGLALGYLIFSIACAPFVYLAASRLIGLGLRDMARNLTGIVISTLVMFGSVMILLHYCRHFVALAKLAIIIPLAILIYAICLHLGAVRGYQEISHLVRSRLQRRVTSADFADPSLS